MSEFTRIPIEVENNETEETNETNKTNETEETNDIQPKLTILSEDPKIFTIDNFITPDECDHMIKLAIPELIDSVVSDSKGGYVSSGRTSKTAWIDHFHDKITSYLSTRISEEVNMPIENAEKYQIVHYGETNEYRSHYDSWDHNGSDKTLRCIKHGGPRVLTALVYLNKVEEGGSTRFDKLNIDVQPAQGKLLVFQNTYTGSINKHLLSQHAGMPIVKGEKYIFNLWFRECPKSMLYSEFNPGYYTAINKKTSESIHTPIKVESVSESNIFKLHPEKNILKFESLLTKSECDDLINICTFSESKYPSAWIKNVDQIDIINTIAKICRTTPDFLENMNVIKYGSHVVHGPFQDAYDISTDKGKTYTEKLGQRVQTISICLSDKMKYAFPKLNTEVICNKGTVMIYDNVGTTRNRDENMCHRLTNDNDIDGYIINVYVREKDKSGNVNKNFQFDDTQTKDTTNNDTVVSNPIHETPNIKENHLDTFNTVLNLFENKKITRGWAGHKQFIYGFKGDFSYFNECVLRFKKLRDDGKGLMLKNVNKEYVFDEFTPVIASEVVHTEMLALLMEYYRKTIENKVFQLGDRQSNRFKAHNEPFSRFLHYEILPLIEAITSKKLKPTYTYLSSYVNDSELPAHTDREDCEYTVSFLVNKDKDWPILLHKVKQPVKYKGRSSFTPKTNECLSLDCESGGLIIFSGTDHIHFREKFTGEFYDILLLHYRSDD